MNTIIILASVVVIAIVGSYFAIQFDKKDATAEVAE